jgi:hypothetical protein
VLPVQALAVSPEVAVGGKTERSDPPALPCEGAKEGTCPAIPEANLAALISARYGAVLLLSTYGYTGCGFEQRVFDVASSQELTVYSKHGNVVLPSAFSPDGRLVATGGASPHHPRTGGAGARGYIYAMALFDKNSDHKKPKGGSNHSRPVVRIWSPSHEWSQKFIVS